MHRGYPVRPAPARTRSAERVRAPRDLEIVTGSAVPMLAKQLREVASRLEVRVAENSSGFMIAKQLQENWQLEMLRARAEQRRAGQAWRP
jgi:hypothetical protein